MGLTTPSGTAVNDDGKSILKKVGFGTFTTASRPSSANDGDLIYNTDTLGLQAWDNSQSAWIDINPLETTEFSVSPSSSYYQETNGDWTTYIFTASATLTTGNIAQYKRETSYAHYFIVGGGGGTGARLSGGAGGGGVNMGTVELQSNLTYPITVGAGGALGNPATGPTTDENSGKGSNGSYSAFGANAAEGGGAGNPFSGPGGNGGCGGGCGYSGTGKPGIAGLANGPFVRKWSSTTGHPGNVGAGRNGPTSTNLGNGATGGGGGAGSPGLRAYGPFTPNRVYKSGNGGNGVKVPSIHTVPTAYGETRPDGQYFGGGGGGGASRPGGQYAPTSQAGSGGYGGGGNGGKEASGQAGDTNTGGGAGGAGQRDYPFYYPPGSNGGSGIVIITIKTS